MFLRLRRSVLPRSMGAFLAFCMLSLGLTGCTYFRKKAAERYVYVTARQTFLRDRVAAVSNRTGTASNGEKLVVLERARRFLKVRTPRGEVGWIEEKLTASQDVANQFEQLRANHEKDPAVATASSRDEVYLHIAPGRETERFYRLAEGDQLSLLERASVPKNATPGANLKPKPGARANVAASTAAKPQEPKPVITAPEPALPAADAVAEVAPPPVMEDWWLVRNGKGQTGWIYSHMIDVAEPDVLARFAEGQRIVGAYLIEKVEDPDSGVIDNGQPVTSIPEYVTVLSPYKAGLPYDFDQIRVFIWNVKKHRYETSFRERNIVGFLPVRLLSSKDPNLKTPLGQMELPTFTYRVLSADAPIPTPDPVTGMVTPSKLITKTMRLEGSLCRRLLPPGTSAPAEAHPVQEDDKKSKDKGKKKHKAKP